MGKGGEDKPASSNPTQEELEVAALEQLRLRFPNSVDAFASMLDTLKQRALRAVQDYAFGTVEIPKDSMHMFQTYRTGMRDFQNPHLVPPAAEGDREHPARLPFSLTSDMELCLYIAGTTRFRAEHLQPGELLGGMSALLGPLGIDCTLENAQAMIARWDASSYTCKDNRLHVADFDRMYRNGTDPAFKVLEEVAVAACAEEAMAATQARPQARARAEKAHQKVCKRDTGDLQQEASAQRAACQASRTQREVETLLERLCDEVERCENGGLRREESEHPPTYELAMRLRSMDLGATGELATSQVSWALEVSGLGLTPAEAMLLGCHFGTTSGGTRMRWPAFLRAVGSGAV
eukprot:CAMPEP_0182908308 /NCGR_PEP_ID=MMETSP0034_2-20130328/35139_1 /TAXON_ID=156128 /ORGANISM="Nephroselmis pyriformis, Strain CCMP717" /LENGTH=349 /DNA_ID=CAMNT_0025044479 /DNA_START=36 /DNA_END=1082 /DNA_ORIENTATION=+